MFYYIHTKFRLLYLLIITLLKTANERPEITAWGFFKLRGVQLNLNVWPCKKKNQTNIKAAL